MLKKILTISTILTIFVFYILMQNYQPSNKQSVAVAIIEKHGKILIALRTKSNYPNAKWAFPGGTVEAGETLLDCLRRELHEELGINAEIGDYFGTTSFYTNDKEIELHAFRVNQFSGKITLNHEHTEFAWVTPTELSNYEMLDADKPFIKLLQEKG